MTKAIFVERNSCCFAHSTNKKIKSMQKFLSIVIGVIIPARLWMEYLPDINCTYMNTNRLIISWVKAFSVILRLFAWINSNDHVIITFCWQFRWHYTNLNNPEKKEILYYPNNGTLNRFLVYFVTVCLLL